LVLSSLTCELAHKALLRNRRAACKNWLFVTIALGFIFIGMQGYEWGELLTYYQLTPTSSYVGTIFYLITGFHGFHVITGLLMLFLVYARLEMGSFDRKRHFSMNAASWYWHFVDVIWLFVFFCLYVGLQRT
jgi:cytochrome c oxidase subunit 3